MATGVLVLGVGRATRLLTYLVGAEKAYAATVRLGQATVTDDAEGEVTAERDASGVTDAALAGAVRALTGPIQQVPSAVSAIKVGGKRSYARVRAGEDVALAARPVTVSAFTVDAVRRGVGASGACVDVDLTVECSSGTYVRALARDLGAALGTGGHLTALRRTHVGPYGLDLARTLEQVEADPGVLPLAEAARSAFPVRELDAVEAVALGHGRALQPAGSPRSSAEAAPVEQNVPVAAFAPDGTLVALVADRDGATRPLVVLAPSGSGSSGTH
jgi:tRNA pseudouridine55 synthase